MAFFYRGPYSHGWQCAQALLGAGVVHQFLPQGPTSFQDLYHWHQTHNDWAIGHISYSCVSILWPSLRHRPCWSGFPDVYFFVPEVLIKLHEDRVEIGLYGSATEAENMFRDICQLHPTSPHGQQGLQLKPTIAKKHYLQHVQDIQQHIKRGDCYELNFCFPFVQHSVKISPVSVFQQLPIAPFSAFYRWYDAYLLCASPERYLSKQGSSLTMQPMKGTMPRGQNAAEDDQHKHALMLSPKERAENTIVVDLIRNDLAHTAIPGSVRVTEWLGIYTYPTVHQMVSTICSELDPKFTFADVLATTFPMESMTGAPKKRVLELIDHYESWPRGLYSGTIGYITPNGDLDLNVVIRSLLYNSIQQQLIYPIGSGITHYSDPKEEWEECMLKTRQLAHICN